MTSGASQPGAGPHSRAPFPDAGGATIAFTLGGRGVNRAAWGRLPLPRRNTVFAALVIVGVFLAFAGDGLRAYFTPDEMMNLYGAWFRPLAESDRPVGALFYRALFDAFGLNPLPYRPARFALLSPHPALPYLLSPPLFAAFGLNPLPYRLACFAILSANLALLYVLCRKLSSSREVAALACLLGAYHAHLADLYYSTDTVYDLLCFLFYFLALICYAEVCSRAWPWRTLVLTMYLVALAAKEMAVMLPVFLALYDLIYDPPAPNLAATRAWTGRELRRLSPFAVVTVGYILLKTVGPGRVTANSDFLPRVSWQVLIDGWKHYAFDLFYGAIAFTGPRVVLLWAVLLAIVLALRKRDLLFALCVILIGILPVVLIPERGFYAVYLTLPGWYLFAAQTLTSTRDRLLPAGTAARPAILFLLVAACLVPLHWRQKPRGKAWVAEAHQSVRGVLEPLRQFTVPRGAKVLVLDDPFPKEDFILTFMFRLTFRDDEIQVRRGKAPFTPPPGEVYDWVFTYIHIGDQLELVRSGL